MSLSAVSEQIDKAIQALSNIKSEMEVSQGLGSEFVLDTDSVANLEKRIVELSLENKRLYSYIESLEDRISAYIEKNLESIAPSPIPNDIPDGAVYVSNYETGNSVDYGKETQSGGSYDKVPFVLKTCSLESTAMSTEGRYIFSMPSSLNVVRLCWSGGKIPGRVLIVKKKDNPSATMMMKRMINWLAKQGVSVLVEPEVLEEVKPCIVSTWRDEDRYRISSMVDFVITLGGDGTLLFASTLFPKAVPPVISFHMGTLGFLTPFSADSFEYPLTHVISGNVPLTVRSRMEYQIVRYSSANIYRKSIDYFPDDDVIENPKPKVLNDIVIDRGTAGSMVELNCYIDADHITTVHADGLIIATPTGSTAYSMSAGGSMVHPLTPGMLMTPICPHTLSFRQMLFPDSTVLRIEVSMESRCSASVSFDGQFKEYLDRGDALIIRMSKYPVPTVSPDDSNHDWFRSVREGLHWNKATSAIVKRDKTDSIYRVPSSNRFL